MRANSPHRAQRAVACASARGAPSVQLRTERESRAHDVRVPRTSSHRSACRGDARARETGFALAITDTTAYKARCNGERVPPRSRSRCVTQESLPFEAKQLRIGSSVKAE